MLHNTTSTYVFSATSKKQAKIICPDTYVWLFSFFSWRVEALVPSGSGLWSIKVCTQLIRLDVSSAYRCIDVHEVKQINKIISHLTSLRIVHR